MAYDIIDVNILFEEIIDIAVCKNCLHRLSVRKCPREG